MAFSELTGRQAFALDEVTITDAYYLAAQTSDIAFLNQFDVNRLPYWFQSWTPKGLFPTIDGRME